MEDAILTICPHCHGIFLSARRIDLHPSQDIDLFDVRLELAQLSVPVVHFLRIRPKDKPGLTMPKVGFHNEGGLITGIGASLPLSRQLIIGGGTAIRSRQGMESTFEIQAPDTLLKIDYLFSAPEHLFRIRTRSSYQHHIVDLNSNIDWLSSDRKIVEQLSFFSIQKAITHTHSQVSGSARLGTSVFEIGFSSIQSFSHQGNRYLDNGSIPGARLQISFPSIPLFDSVFPSLVLDVLHDSLPNSELFSSESTRLISFTTLSISPSLYIATTVGPLSLVSSISSRHSIGQLDIETTDKQSLHAVGLSLDISLPLFRDYSSLRHTITPDLRYRIIPWKEGDIFLFEQNDDDLVWENHTIEMGLSSSFSSNKNNNSAVTRVFERLSLPLNSIDAVVPYLCFQGRLQSDFLSFSIDSGLDSSSFEPSFFGATLSPFFLKSRFDIGARWIDNIHTSFLQSTIELTNPLSSLDRIPVSSSSSAETFFDFELPLKNRLSLIGGNRIGVYPRVRLHSVWYGIVFKTSCNCLTVSLTAIHSPKANEYIPSVLLRANLYDF